MPYILAGDPTRALTLGGYILAAAPSGTPATNVTNLQAAIDAAAVIEGGVLLRGTYTTDAELDWTPGFKGFLGYDNSSIEGGVDSGYLLYQSDETTIVDGLLDNVTFVTSATTRGGVRLLDTLRFTVRNCSFTDHYEWALIFAPHAGEDVDDTIRHISPLVEYNEFITGANNEDQVLTFMNTVGCRAASNLFNAAGSSGSNSFGINCYQRCIDFIIEDNDFGFGSAGITVATDCENITIRNNVFTGRKGILACIPSDNAYTGYEAYTTRLKISGNLFSLTGTDEPCINLSSVDGYRIEDNVFVGNDHACIYIRHGFAAATAAQFAVRGVITGNIFEGNMVSDSAHDIKAPIQFISGASTPATVDLYLDILNNVFDNQHATFTQERAVVFYSDHGTEYDHCHLDGNTVDAAVEAILAGLSLHRFNGGAVEGDNITYGTNPGDLF